MKFAPDEREADATAPDLYVRRREFLKKAGLFAATGTAWGTGLVALSGRGAADAPPPPPPKDPPGSAPAAGLAIVRREDYSKGEEPTPFDAITTYNNYYELGLSKSDPALRAGTLQPRPWTIRVDGEAPAQTLDIDTILSWFGLEERIYRMRCVEAWSMVIPWLGFPLAELVKRLAPTSRAKYVEFTTLLDPNQLPNQENDVLPWPYVEALRIDEATNPLAFLAVGLHGKRLPGQNGAPIRLVVPWKYGFKGAKSIARIRFTESQPKTTWNRVAPSEYGFYANVNPLVDHPRWSQASERRIGELRRRDTLPFNGYARHVAHLYGGLDLRENF